jgi:2-polyprenyl-3-methyl-5-hydroxy-6-metoxy-1,4-benzoquinol methylase
VFSIHFSHCGNSHILPAGGRFAVPRSGGFSDLPTSELNSLVAEVKSGRPWREVVAARYAQSNDWLYRIVTDPSRTSFIDHVLPHGTGPVLDIGAGWGQVSRPLAALRPVVALEPVAERMAFIQAAASQDGVMDNLACIEADYFEIGFTTPFEVICAIGVLEWAGAYQKEGDPQEHQLAFLRKARRELADGGTLVIGIENRLGLKYLLGCPDDHLGLSHLACLPTAQAREQSQKIRGHPLLSFTYSLVELEQLLRDAGFGKMDFFAAFPDYKLTSQMIPLQDGGRALNDWLQQETPPPEHDGYHGTSLAPELQDSLNQHYRQLAAGGVARHFVPSFFIKAS